MGGMIVFGLVLAFLVGGLLLALTMGYMSAEQTRAAEQAQRHGQVIRAAAAIPSVFAGSDRDKLPGMRGVDDLLLARIESHVKEELALVGEFVHYPSVHSLYRQGSQGLRVH